ncbi:MAG TPA: Gfo/Idh/MocA family oxidoreductase [Candidatus Binataceae bacterium]|jgi:predicted dehydrogenase|nr:Gfo/Idh/MocA family oxidoreductase [Candidatus Binataceae bacterium]
MATEKIRVGIIGANVRYGWGSSAHIPALSALPEFEITAVCTSRQETAEATARHFGISHAFADPYKMVQHPDVDLVSIWVRVPFHHQMGMAALNAGKHLFCEWPLAATTEQAQQMRDLAVRKGVRHMVGLQARGARAINRVRDLVADGYVGKVLSCTMIVATPSWGAAFTLARAYLADRSTGATLMTIRGGHSIDALCFCLGEFKEISSVVATPRQRVKIVETGETIQMTSPDQVLLSGVLQSGAVASVHVKGGTANGTGFLFEIHGTEGDLAITPADPRQEINVQVSEFTVRGAQRGKPLAELAIPESYRWVPPTVPVGLPFNVAQLFIRMAQGIREGKSVSPDFDVAVKRHQLLDAIQKASDTGLRQIL